MTVEELWNHCATPPCSLALKDGDIMEITHYNKKRTQELLRKYADRRVKDWCVGYIPAARNLPPSYFLHVMVESEDGSQEEKTDANNGA